MTEHEKKLLQAKHRLEEAQARDRVKERKARTRRLIQEGALLFFPEGRTYSPPRRGGGISCGNRALSEGDCGVCGRRWTRLHFFQTASLVHAVGKGGHFGSPYLWGGILPPHLAACLCQPATGSLTQIQGRKKGYCISQ